QADADDRSEFAALVARIDELAASVPTDAPWLAANAAQLDALSVANWLDTEVAEGRGRRALRQVVEGLMTAASGDMSMLTLLHSARTSGTLAAALGIDGGAQELRLVGGLHGLAKRVAHDLGDRVRLSTPVHAIRQEPDHVVAATPHGDVKASAVVVAVPPSGWKTITFDPGLPLAHAALPEAMPMGSVIKVQAVFEQPFWRDAGFSGLVTDDEGVFAFVVDNSSNSSSEGVLASFISAGSVTTWGDAALGADAVSRRREAFLEHLRRAFGADVPATIDYVDRDWTAVPFVGGGYSGVMRPGGWTRCGPALRQPHGRIHWASAESATMWTGYVDGAIQSGERAAAEVASALASTTTA
ncbi:MAG TPA: FAD-dependent oxidoreductase, partial [Actinomycetes bacterium]|nr:FAD-dependent oxidoreductase [Actinomycetes bacterium]